MQIVVALACVLFVLALFLGLLVLILRLACAVCGVEKPGFVKGSVVVFTSWLVLSVFEAVLLGLTEQLYEAFGYPYWEARLVCTIVALPAKMLIDSALHVVLLRVSLGKAVEVWFAKVLIELGLIAGVAAMVAVYLLAAGGR